MAQAEPLVMRDFSGGINTNITSGLSNPNILRYVVNMYNDGSLSKTGALTSRYGFTNLSSSANRSIDDDIVSVVPADEIVGLYSYNVNKLIAAVTLIGASQTRLYSFNTDFWTEIGTTPITVGSTEPTRFTSYDDGTIMWVFATFTNSIRSWNSTSTANDWGTTHLSGAPSTASIVKIFKGRIYIANGNPEIYYSNFADITTGVFSWTSTNIIRSNVNNNGDTVTGLEVNGTQLLIFFNKSLFTFDGESLQSEPLFQYGALNQEVIQTIDGVTFFCGEDESGLGVWVYSGSFPEKISDPIKEFLTAANMSLAAVPNELGSWQSGSNYYLSIGDVTLEGVLYPNIVLVYSNISKSWTTVSIDKQSGTKNNYFKFSTTLLRVGSINQVNFTILEPDRRQSTAIIAGTPLGLTSDDNIACNPVQWYPSTEIGDDVEGATNNPIKILIQTHELEHGSRSRLKTVNKFNVFASGNYGFVTVNMRVNGGAWINLGKLTGKTTTFSPAKKGNYFEYQLIGSNTGEPFVFEGFDFFNVTIDNYPL